MDNSRMPFCKAVQQRLMSTFRKIVLANPIQSSVIAALVAIGACRLLLASYLSGFDDLIGRPGDALLVLAVLLMLTPHLLIRRPLPAVLQDRRLEPLDAILENHMRLEHEIDKSLNEVVGDTENSALAIIQQVRQLYDTANRLVVYLDDSSQKTGNMGNEITDSVAHAIEIGAFIQQLPAKMERDLQGVNIVVKEIKELGGLLEAVRGISMQSHLLAINAAIEASRAGSSGDAFRVIATEMRILASNSGEVAASINQGLTRAREGVEAGMASSIAESTLQLAKVSLAGVSIQKLLDNFEDINQFNKTRFAVVTQHNEDLARDIAEVLGQIQYQDVVRQRIERIQITTGKRNASFQEAGGMQDQAGVKLALLPELLELILNDYLAEENKHKHSEKQSSDNSSELKIELF